MREFGLPFHFSDTIDYVLSFEFTRESPGRQADLMTLAVL